MHGAPATAAEGCHGAMPATSAAPMAGGHDAAVMDPAALNVHGFGPAVRAADGMPGMLCVSTPAHERTSLSAPALCAVAGAGVLALWAPARLRAAAGGTGWQGPPGGGRDLLLRACIART
ncbi:hypothetical protein ACGFNV_35355 [Streptomyces sp. NPDC048751]|uniref:hypothetical protein n=1 Tax=Streptomyces sp. NPDC048751 TaxID=3365591 RepID=UPI00371C88D7